MRFDVKLWPLSDGYHRGKGTSNIQKPHVVLEQMSFDKLGLRQGNATTHCAGCRKRFFAIGLLIARPNFLAGTVHQFSR